MNSNLLVQRSLRTQIILFSLLIFFLTLGLGLFSFSKLNEVNEASADIRGHWLQSTLLLGDLNNDTSDYRAAEANLILSENPSVEKSAREEIITLKEIISLTEKKYQTMKHGPAELKTFQEFEQDWEKYKKTSDEVLSLYKNGKADQARKLYMGQSRIDFATASTSLSTLTSQTVKGASSASDYAANIYSQAQKLILLAFLVTIFCIAYLLYYIRTKIALPLLALADKMRALAANQTDIEIKGTDRPDEIGEMSRAVVIFQKNAIALSQSQLKLIEQASSLEEKLHLEQRMTELQRNFISMVSHEFRTPLTIIDGQAQRLIKLREPISSHDIVERAHKIRNSVKRVTKVMENIITSSSLYDGTSQLPFAPRKLDPCKLIADVCRINEENNPQCQIRFDYDEQPMLVFGDQDLLFLIFSNLISNAIKYSNADKEIRVTAYAAGDFAVITIEDKGIGIPEKDMAQLFERYHRGSNVTGIGGTGIGLHLVKMAISLHEGDIQVQSKEGAGSRFIVRLPLAN